MHQKDFDTVIEAWKQTVPFDVPTGHFIQGWIQSLPVADIITIITVELGRKYTEGRLNAHNPEEHAGKFVSSCVRQLRDQRSRQPSYVAIEPHDFFATETVSPSAPKPAAWRSSWPEIQTVQQ